MRWLVVLAVVPLLLAGCTGAEESSGAPMKRSTTSTTGPLTLNATLANATTNLTVDTLFLHKAPWLNTSLEQNDSVLAVKGPYTTQTFAWNRTLNATGNVTGGRLVVWLLLPHTATQVGVGSDVGCTLAWTLTVVNETATRAVDGGCGSAGTGTVPPGEHRFDIAMPPPAQPLEVGVGTNVILQVTVGVVQPDGAAAYILGGSERYDSRLVLDGLAEPLDTAAPAPDADD